MKTLIVTAVDPQGPPQGERLRLENIVRGSMVLGPTDVWIPVPILNPVAQMRELWKAGSPYMVRRLYSKADEPCDRYDIVISFQLRMAPYALACQGAVHVLELTDSLGLFREKLQTFGKGLLRQAMLWRIEALEVKWAQRFTEAWVSGWQDQEWLAHRGVLSVLVPNAVREKILLPPGDARELLFVANLSYLPNRLGIQRFLRQVWPTLAREGLTLHVAGSGTETIRGEGVVAHGFVKDLRALYERVGICISPVELGTGTQNKILEALGYGRPVVTVPQAYSALYPAVRRGVASAATPSEWVREVRALQERGVYLRQRQKGFDAVDINGYPVSRRLRQLRG